MKKLLFSIFMLCCMSSAWAQQNTIKVKTAKELSDALENNADNSNAVIQLVADIDMAQYEKFSPIDHYNGSLTGYYEDTEEGETITTYRVIKNLKTSLVEDMTGAKVSGIMIMDGERGGYWRNNACFICEDAKDCDFTDIILVNCHYKDSDFGGDWYASETGLITNKMDNCKVTRVSVLCSSLCSDGSEIGGITGVATNGCTFTECLVDGYTSIYTTKEPNAFVGGLVGKSEDCKFLSCKNRGIVSASPMSDNLGGISGYSTKCTFTDCYNSGTVSQLTPTACDEIRAKSKGFFALYLATVSTLPLVSKKWYDTVQNNIEEEFSRNVDFIPENMAAEAKYGWGTVAITVLAVAMTAYEISMKIYNANAPDEVGGITSAAYACTFDRCTNAGFIACRDAYCGGIVGYADTKGGTITKINNCINIGYIQGNEQTGGIVGYLQDSHATNCFNAGAVDCLKSTNGPIYGDTNAKGATITTCFAMEHGARYGGNAVGGEGVIVKFSEKDVVGGRAAYEMNRIIGKDIFRQTVGEDRCPNFTSDVVYASDIRTELDVTYRVYDADGLCAALMYPYAQIELQDDIDFKNNYISLYRGSCKFHGSINGNGHTIKNIKTEHTEQDENFDEDNERNAMIQFAEDAIFENLTLDSMTVKRFVYVSGLVGNSKNCTYEDINVKHSTIYAEATFVGGLVYESDHDTFTRCTTDDKTDIRTNGIYGSVIGSIFGNVENANAGGLAGKASGSTFTDCVNRAIVSGKMDVVGGIVAYDEGSTFTRCINKGYIRHNSSLILDNDELGGIVAEAKNSKFYECINTGNLDCEDENCGGIVGLGTNVTIINCLNAAYNLISIQKANTCGGIIGYAKNSMVANCASIADRPIIGDFSDINVSSGNNYRVKKSNDRTNEWELSVDKETMASGIVCRWLNNGTENRKERRTVWHQLLKGWNSDDIPFPTSDGHAEVMPGDLPHTDISTADDLIAFANAVNNGEQFKVGVLTNDIDMPEGTTWEPIGTNDHPFRGIFDGRGFTINNLKVNKSGSGTQGAALFGVIDVFADINNVIIGKDSEIKSNVSGNEHGSAGIVGIYLVSKRRWWGNASIRNCGSYANVTATKHAAGILGRVIADVNETHKETSPFIKLYIDSCYNAGTITASNGNSALLCGYARDHAVVRDCWSAGHLVSTGSGNAYELNSNGDNEYFVGYNQTVDIKNCIAAVDLFDVSQKGVTKYGEEVAYSGQLTYMLNGNDNNPEHKLRWKQDIGKELAPISCRINIGTPEEMILENKGVTYSRYILSATDPYGTVFLPYAIKSNNRIEFFTLKEIVEEDNTTTAFHFTPADEVPPCTPALYRARYNGTCEFDDIQNGYNFTCEVSTPDEWNFVGTFKGRSFTQGATHVFYILTSSDLTGAVVGHTPEVTIPPFTAFFYGPNVYELIAAGKTSRVVIEENNGTTTVVESLPIGKSGDRGQGEASYTLMGTKAPAGYLGIVIRNGRKYVQ